MDSTGDSHPNIHSIVLPALNVSLSC